MNPVIRGIIVYVFLMLIFRIIGKRTLNEASTFDMVLLLIISEVTQQGLVGEDFSITTSALLICTLMGLDLIFTILKTRLPFFNRVVEGAPLIIVDNGKPLKTRMYKSQVDVDDVLQAARMDHGLARMEEIKYAVLEKDGTISIIPFGDEKDDGKE